MSRRGSPGQDARESELAGLGLTRYQASAYVTLHDLGVARPKQVADAAQIPLARAYEALDDLVRLRLAEPVDGREKRYRALAVDAALDREVERVSDGIATLSANGDVLEDEFTPEGEAAVRGGFLMHPGGPRFAVALEEHLRGAGRASAVLAWTTARQAFGGVPGLLERPWERLVILASPAEVAEMAPLAEGDLDVRVLPARPWAVERVAIWGAERPARVLVRLPSESAAAGIALETAEAAFVEDAAAFVSETHARAVPLAAALADPVAALAAVEDAAWDDGRAREFLAALAASAPREVLVALPAAAEASFRALFHALAERPGVGVRVLTTAPLAPDVVAPTAVRVVSALPFEGAVDPDGTVCEAVPGGTWRLSTSRAKSRAFASAFESTWQEAGGAVDKLVWGPEAFFEAWTEVLGRWEGEALLVVGPGEAALAVPYVSLFLDVHAPEGRSLRVIADGGDPSTADLEGRGGEVRTTAAPFVSGGVLAGDTALLWPSPIVPDYPAGVLTRDPEVLDHFRETFARSWATCRPRVVATPAVEAPVAPAKGRKDRGKER